MPLSRVWVYNAYGYIHVRLNVMCTQPLRDILLLGKAMVAHKAPKGHMCLCTGPGRHIVTQQVGIKGASDVHPTNERCPIINHINRCCVQAGLSYVCDIG